MRHIPNLATRGSRTLAENRDPPAGGLRQSGQSAQQRSLARSVVSEDRVKAPAFKFSGNSTQSRKPSKLLDDVVNDDAGGGSRDGVSHRHRESIVKSRGEIAISNLCTFPKICKARPCFLSDLSGFSQRPLRLNTFE